MTEILDPSFEQPHEALGAEDDTLDTGITGPDIEVDPDFSRPSTGLDEDVDPSFSQMPLPDDFTKEPLTETTEVEYEPWELLCQFPYLLGQALRIALSIGKGLSDEERYQALHDIKVYLTKSLEVYDRKQRPHLFTEGGYIKGTQISYIGSPSDKHVVMRSALVRLAFAKINRHVAAFLDPDHDKAPPSVTFWGIQVKNIENMLQVVLGDMQAIIDGRNREEIKLEEVINDAH